MRGKGTEISSFVGKDDSSQNKDGESKDGLWRHNVQHGNYT